MLYYFPCCSAPLGQLCWIALISEARALCGYVAPYVVALLMSPLRSLQDILGGGADKGPEEAEPEEGHVPEDDRGGPRCPY